MDRSGKYGRATRLRIGGRAQQRQCRCCIEPDDGCRRAFEFAERGLGIVGWCDGLRDTTQTAATALCLLLIRPAILRCRASIVRADQRPGKRIGSDLRCSPAGRNRRKELHQQRKHDDWKKPSQPPSHNEPTLQVFELPLTESGVEARFPTKCRWRSMVASLSRNPCSQIVAAQRSGRAQRPTPTFYPRQVVSGTHFTLKDPLFCV